MTIALTTTIAVPNVTRVKVAQVALFDEDSEARIVVKVLSTPVTNRTKSFQLIVRNGSCTGLNTATAATTFDGDVEPVGGLVVADGYDQIEAAYRSGASKAAAFRAVEQKLLDLAIFGAGLAGTVG